jgi:ubiquinone/menaquinone biosynthesis C-methylase UbiE
VAGGRNGARDGTEVIPEEYSRLAADYDRRWRDYVTVSVRETLQRLVLRSGERLLDVGCGTGELLRAVRQSVPDAAVIGADIAPQMLGAARRKLGAQVPLVGADAARLPFRAESFDVVVTSSSFHFWSDPSAALAELRRVLRPQGRLVVTDWCDDYLACKVWDRVMRVLDPAHQRAYGTRACANLLDRAGYDVSVVERYKINWLWGLMTARAVRPPA